MRRRPGADLRAALKLGQPGASFPSWLRAYRSFLAGALAHSQYLRFTGRLEDPESLTDLVALELELERIQDAIALDPPPSRGIEEPAPSWLVLAGRGQMRNLRRLVKDDARALRSVSARVVGSSRDLRRRLTDQARGSAARPPANG
jgi:hypothetical protein